MTFEFKNIIKNFQKSKKEGQNRTPQVKFCLKKLLLLIIAPDMRTKFSIITSSIREVLCYSVQYSLPSRFMEIFRDTRILQ